jgi:hypothetical protein
VTKQRNLDRTAVLRGLGLPVAGRVPPICSMGGLGTFTQGHLVPTLAMISGPWSLYAPSFARKAIDFKRMRSQLLAIGDTVLALDGIPSGQIAATTRRIASSGPRARPDARRLRICRSWRPGRVSECPRAAELVCSPR